jgi:hypothetical protein
MWRQSHLLYGDESIPRVNYCHHPLAEDFFYLFLAADPESLLVPVIKRDPSTPDLPDRIIGRLMEPFWRQGWGKVLCSVCLADVFNGEFQPVFLTRNEFLLHWVEKHLSSLVAVATFSATRLNSRLYQGHVPPGQPRQLFRGPDGQPSPAPHQLLWFPGSCLLLKYPQQSNPEAGLPACGFLYSCSWSEPAGSFCLCSCSRSEPAGSLCLWPWSEPACSLWEQLPDSCRPYFPLCPRSLLRSLLQPKCRCR